MPCWIWGTAPAPSIIPTVSEPPHSAPMVRTTPGFRCLPGWSFSLSAKKAIHFALFLGKILMIFKMIFYSICVTLKKQLRPLELPPLVGRFSINYRRIQRVSPIHLYTSRSISPHSLRFGISCVLNESRRKYTMNLWNTLFGKALMTFFISMCPFWSCAAPFPLEPPMVCLFGLPF